MRLIDADALMKIMYERKKTRTWNDAVSLLGSAPTVDAVKATMPWIDPDGTERMLDEVSYEIGYAQGQKDTKRQGYWVRFYGDHIHMGLRPKWDCCSECGMVGTPTRYCSNCGARMNGVDDE